MIPTAPDPTGTEDTSRIHIVTQPSRLRALSVADWRALVRSNRNISGETRAILLDLAHEMKQGRQPSVPEMAELFGVSERTIRGRLAEARRAGLLPGGGVQ